MAGPPMATSRSFQCKRENPMQFLPPAGFSNSLRSFKVIIDDAELNFSDPNGKKAKGRWKREQQQIDKSEN
jgi:hypothetical protein